MNEWNIVAHYLFIIIMSAPDLICSLSVSVMFVSVGCDCDESGSDRLNRIVCSLKKREKKKRAISHLLKWNVNN